MGLGSNPATHKLPAESPRVATFCPSAPRTAPAELIYGSLVIALPCTRDQVAPAPPTAKPTRHPPLIQVLLPALAPQVSSQRLCAMIGKESEGEGVRSVALSSPNNCNQRTGTHQVHAPYRSARFTISALRLGFGGRSLMRGR